MSKSSLSKDICFILSDFETIVELLKDVESIAWPIGYGLKHGFILDPLIHRAFDLKKYNNSLCEQSKA